MVDVENCADEMTLFGHRLKELKLGRFKAEIVRRKLAMAFISYTV